MKIVYLGGVEHVQKFSSKSERVKSKTAILIPVLSWNRSKVNRRDDSLKYIEFEHKCLNNDAFLNLQGRKKRTVVWNAKNVIVSNNF